MSRLTHVTFRVSGEPATLAAFDARLKLAVAEHGLAGSCEESHSERTLWYDLKVTGGIPFPPFAAASLDLPDLPVHVEWVDAAVGTRGSALIVAGKLTEQSERALDAVRGAECVHLVITVRGWLELGCAFFAASRDEYLGYALTGEEDAAFRVIRGADGVVEVDATRGSPEWTRRWRIEPGDARPVYTELDPGEPVPEDTYGQLEALAQAFMAQWIWLAASPADEIAVEVDRYRRYGLEPAAANVRAAVVHRLMAGAPEGAARLEHSTVADDERWAVDALARCWPGDGRR